MIAIAGRGNVGSHLAKAFSAVTDMIEIDPRLREAELPANADLIIIAVSDSAIAEVAGRFAAALPERAGKVPVLAHTSGSVPIDALEAWPGPKGVIYPMQTFSKGRALDYSDIPFFIEGDCAATESMLIDTARLVSGKIKVADSRRRGVLHLGAVFACNFANALWGIADDILKEEGYCIQDLLPLIGETAAKLEEMSPAEAQTGPAVRGDFNVMARQEEELKERPLEAEVYRLLSQVIINAKDNTK